MDLILRPSTVTERFSVWDIVAGKYGSPNAERAIATASLLFASRLKNQTPAPDPSFRVTYVRTLISSKFEMPGTGTEPGRVDIPHTKWNECDEGVAIESIHDQSRGQQALDERCIDGPVYKKQIGPALAHYRVAWGPLTMLNVLGQGHAVTGDRIKLPDDLEV